MKCRTTYWLSTALSVVLLMVSVSSADEILDPFGIAVSLGEDDLEVIELSLRNEGDADVAFEIGFAYPDEELGNQGPRRDDFGDSLRFFEYRNRGWCGLAWNGDEIVAADYDNQVIYFWNIEEEDFVDDIRVNYFPWGMAFDGEAYWVAVDNPNRLYQIDREGDQIDVINLNFTPAGVAWDGENLWTYPYNGDCVLRQIDTDGRVLHEFNCRNLAGSVCYALTWVPEHLTGHLWVITETATLMQFSLDFEEETVEVIQRVDYGIRGGTYGLTHDSENLWFSVYTGPNNEDWGWFVIDDGIGEIRWLRSDPSEGEIAAGESETFELTFDPTDLEPGTYHLLVQIEIAGVDEDIQESLIEVSAVMSLEQDVAAIVGGVTGLASGNAVENARAEIDNYLIARFSDDNGEFTIENLPLNTYQLTVTADDFLPHRSEVDLDEAGEFELEIELLHAECNPDMVRIIRDVGVDSDTRVEFTVTNAGNGTLTYQVDRRLVGDADIDPWNVRETHEFGEAFDDSYIHGVVFLDGKFYISGAHNEEPVIYVTDREGEFERLFLQPGEDRRGMRDLTCDSEYIWGSIGNTVYGMTDQGDVVYEWNSVYDPTNVLAWDTDREILWVGSTTTNPKAYTRQGEPFENMQIDRNDLRIYGLAYWSGDPDGYPLYAFTKERDTDLTVLYKFDPIEDAMMLVTYLDTEEGSSPMGAHITSQFDIYSWVFVSVMNRPVEAGGDHVDIWQIEGRKDWMQIDPIGGEIEAEHDQVFELILDAAGLTPAVFSGELAFIHDGVGGETVIPVTMNVAEGNIPGVRSLDLLMGWSLVSVNLQPDEEDVVVLTENLVEEDILLLMKDGFGNFYSPADGFNNIPGWDAAQGYQIKMRREGELVLEGLTVMWNDPIDLIQGWNMVAYFPRTPVDAIAALSGIRDRLLIAKDGDGNFYIPEWDFSNMGNMIEGRGYQMKLAEDTELIYRLELEEDERAFVRWNRSPADSPQNTPGISNTGNNMSLLIIADEDVSGNVTVHAGERLVGSGVLNDGACGIAVWGDDPGTEMIDGALDFQPLEIRFPDSDMLQAVEFENLAGDARYTTDAFWVVKLIVADTALREFEISSIHPNPFNSIAVIPFQLPRREQVNLTIYDISGRIVAELFAGRMNEGYHNVIWDASEFTTGIYFCRMDAGSYSKTIKLALVK